MAVSELQHERWREDARNNIRKAREIMGDNLSHGTHSQIYNAAAIVSLLSSISERIAEQNELMRARIRPPGEDLESGLTRIEYALRRPRIADYVRSFVRRRRRRRR